MKKPKCVGCATCGAPAVQESPAPATRSASIAHVDLLNPLKDLVRCIRNGQLGDFSPLMDEIFDAEHAIRMAERKPLKGLDYED